MRAARWGLVLLGALALGGCFPKQAGPGLSHFAQQAPSVGSPAPLFELRDLDGRAVALADLIGERPVVLQLGSHSCPVYRYRRFSMQELWEDYGDRVHFLAVYTVEAHPKAAPSPYRDTAKNGGEWDLLLNRLVGVRMPLAGEQSERDAAARHSAQAVGLPYPMVIDGMDDATWQAYGAAPSAGYVIDLEGRVALAQPWVNPADIRPVLDRLLARAAE